MSLTTTEIGNVCLVCDAQRCGEALVSSVSQADVLATARASRWFVGTLHFCDRHAYLGGLANPTQTNAQLAAAYAAAIAAPDLPTAAILRTELIARGAADQPVVAASGIAPSVLTVDGQILTRAAGVPAAITRTNLAADAAFTAAFATAAQGATADLAIPKATLTSNGDILTRVAGIPALITRANLAADAAFTAAYMPTIAGLRRFSTGRYYTTDNSAIDGTIIPAVGTLIVTPFTVGVAHAFDRITLEVTATFAAAEHRVGIYADTSGLPDALVAGTESVLDTHTGTGVISATINVTLQPGLYWLAAVAQTAGTSATVRGRTATTSPYIGQDTGGNLNVGAYSRTGVAAALPSNFGAVSNYQVVTPKVMLRAT